jgi:hypothetical protein
MLTPLVAVPVWADRKLNIGGRGRMDSPASLKWIVLGADVANREFD